MVEPLALVAVNGFLAGVRAKRKGILVFGILRVTAR
jgi:hypothetical protein